MLRAASLLLQALSEEAVVGYQIESSFATFARITALELVEEEALPPEILESKRKPRNFGGPSYIYIAGQNMSMHPGSIVAYENPAFGRDGLNVLFMDSHVQWMKPDEFLRELEATYKRLGREIPEIKFGR